jgi:hypothetical protein
MDQRTVVLRNRSRYQGFECSLYHAFVCRNGGTCICLKRKRTEPDRINEFMLAEQTLYIPPRGQSDPLPAAVLTIPQVRVALREHQLVEEKPEAAIQVIKRR